MRFISILLGIGLAATLNPGLAYGNDTNNLDAIRQAAQAALSATTPPAPEEEVFTAGSLSLQALNPEISVTGDFLWRYADESEQKSDFTYRTLALHLQAYLDPYTRFKAAVEFNEEGVELGEAYFTRFGILPGVNVTLGKFRQQFGVVNRWHKHALDQVDFPLALQAIFGEDGLNQSGVSADWLIPDFLPCSQRLTVQVTDGSNEGIYSENVDNSPSLLAHYKAFRDLTASTYAEGGLSLLYGENNSWDTSAGTLDPEDKALSTWVGGADFTLMWEPTDNMRNRNVTWRSEAYFLNKDLLAPDGSGQDSIHAWGLYSYLESKVARTLVIGVRGDWFAPDTKAYEISAGEGLPLQSSTSDDAYRYQVGPYLTWSESPFVHFRAEYDFQDGSGTGPASNTFWLQAIFAAGPHKHDRY